MIPKDVMDLVAVVNADSTAGNTLCGLLVKEAFTVIGQKNQVEDCAWFSKCCETVENITNKTNNYEDIVEQLRLQWARTDARV